MSLKKSILLLLTYIIKPFYGSWIGKYTPFRQINTLYKKFSRTQELAIRTRYGFDIFVHDNTFIEWHILMHWFWEKNISDLLDKYLKRGDTFLDVWANIWYDSLLASLKVGDTGNVIALEPSGKNYGKLIKNIELNLAKNIQTYKLWLWNIPTSSSVFFSPENPGATSLVETEFNMDFEKEDIQIVVFDDYFSNQKVDFIKMDIEGFEYEAMLGMEKLFQRSKELRMIFEFSPGFYKYKTQDVQEYSIGMLSYLKKMGFTIYHIEDDASLSLIDNFDYYLERFDLVKIKQADLFCEKIHA